MLIGLCSVKGSPGVTTTALALAARWPASEPLVMEADPAGGDLATRWRLPTDPGLVSLTAAARRHAEAGLLREHSHLLADEIRVVLAPAAADQARAALEAFAARGIQVLSAVAQQPDTTVLLDVGRLDTASPSLPLVRSTDALVVLARPQADELAHVATLLSTIPKWTRTPGLVLIGPGYAKVEVEQELRVPVLATLPHDPRGAGFLCGQGRGRNPNRSALGRAAAGLSQALLQHTRTSDEAPGDEEPPTMAAFTSEEVTPSDNGATPR